MAEAMLNEDLRSSPIPELELQIEDKKVNTPESNMSLKNPAEGSDRRKVVQIQLPPKRQKLSQTVTARQVIDAISMSVSQQERIHALSEALLSFGHNIQCAHDEELSTGADVVMTKHLGFVLCRLLLAGTSIRENEQVLELHNEVKKSCEILELLYRGSVESVSESFDALHHDLLPLLINVINTEINERHKSEVGQAKELPESHKSTEGAKGETRMKTPQDSPESRSVTPPSWPDRGFDQDRNESGNVILRKATKILGHFARVEAATQRMAYHPGLLSRLIRVITFTPYDAIPAEARLNSLWVLGNLACNTDCMMMLACHPGLVDALVMSAMRTATEEDTTAVKMEILRSHSIVARALHNVSWAPENKIPLSENQSLVETLAKMVVTRQPSFEVRTRGVGDTILQTRRHAIGTLRQLAVAPRRVKVQLCRHQNGKILENLIDAARNDPDVGIVEKALSTIHALACVDTAEFMMEQTELLSLLKDTVTTQAVTETLKTEASGTLLVLERSITEDMQSFHTLRELLASIRPPTDAKEMESGNMGGDMEPIDLFA